ncbi:MAG: hypothetical protein DHS20C21_19630 [Gemmatimonadota bacterium]|nr:MAG: hypothetical protein DHS20C21_19630 [Gemmatimonadota bacterium]
MNRVKKFTGSALSAVILLASSSAGARSFVHVVGPDSLGRIPKSVEIAYVAAGDQLEFEMSADVLVDAGGKLSCSLSVSDGAEELARAGISGHVDDLGRETWRFQVSRRAADHSVLSLVFGCAPAPCFSFTVWKLPLGVLLAEPDLWAGRPAMGRKVVADGSEAPRLVLKAGRNLARVDR